MSEECEVYVETIRRVCFLNEMKFLFISSQNICIEKIEDIIQCYIHCCFSSYLLVKESKTSRIRRKKRNVPGNTSVVLFGSC